MGTVAPAFKFASNAHPTAIKVLVYPKNASGDVAPVRILRGLNFNLALAVGP